MGWWLYCVQRLPGRFMFYSSSFICSFMHISSWSKFCRVYWKRIFIKLSKRSIRIDVFSDPLHWFSLTGNISRLQIRSMLPFLTQAWGDKSGFFGSCLFTFRNRSLAICRETNVSIWAPPMQTRNLNVLWFLFFLKTTNITRVLPPQFSDLSKNWSELLRSKGSSRTCSTHKKNADSV